MIRASDWAQTAYRYLGRSYSELDCQALLEAMLRDVGIRRNWRGSNAMYRDMAWVGTPEACRQRFGCIPAGAWLFIWADDGGEAARGYTDGLGNASHVGVYTGQGAGAVHASASRGCVCESSFTGKAIPGGWNRVGLCALLDYGFSLTNDSEEEMSNMQTNAVVTAENGKPVNFRKEPRRLSAVYGRLPVGTPVTVLSDPMETWCQVAVGGQTGWMMGAYLTLTDGMPDTQESIPAADLAALEARLDKVEELLDRLCDEWTQKLGWG